MQTYTATVLSCLSLCVVAELNAQRPALQPARQIAEDLRDMRGSAMAVRLLRQMDGPRSVAELDEIGDTLAAIAISSTGKGETNRYARTAATDALIMAAIGSGGTSYAGAAERLYRIARDSRDGMNGGALAGLLRIPDRRITLDYMQRLATIDKLIARTAVILLASSLGPEGLAVLRDLHRDSSVVHRDARDYLRLVAHDHGWDVRAR
jgi:hypothetical protein